MCLSLSIGFSATANAEAITGHHIRQDVYLIDKDGDIAWEYFSTFRPNNKDEEKEEAECDYYEVRDIKTMQLKHRTVYNIFAPTDGYPFVINKLNRVLLENFYYRYLLNDMTLHYVRDYNDVYVHVEYADGTSERIEVEIYADTDLGLDIEFDITPTKNVARLDLYIDSNVWEHMPNGYDYQPVTITSYMGEYNGDDKYNFNLEIQSEEEKLLGGILGWVQNIFNKIGDTFEAIKELPGKIANLLIDGIKNLFVPSSEDIEQFSTKMDNLLEDKLGAVYQVSNTVIEAWDRVKDADEQNTIPFPESKIQLLGGEEFAFGGYDVQIVPEGFAWLATIVKSVAGIVATIAFVNGLRKRYEEVMEG